MLSNFKISTRLEILLAILLAALVIVGAMGLYASSHSNSGMKSLHDDRVVPLLQLNEVSAGMLLNRIAISTAIIQPETMQAQLDKVKANKVRIDQNWDAYMSIFMYDDEKALAQKFAEHRGRFVEEGIKPAMAAMQAGNLDELKRIQIDSLRPLSHSTNEDLRQLVELQEREAKKLYQESDAAYRNMRLISIGLIVLGFALGGLLGFSIITSVSRSTGEMRDAMTRTAADGDLSRRVVVQGRDEIAQAAVSYNGLLDSFGQVIRQVHSSADSVIHTATQLSIASSQITQGSQAQSEAASSTAAAVEEMTVSITSVSENTNEVKKLSEQSLDKTRAGNRSTDEMIKDESG